MTTSRIARKPIPVPAGVEVKVQDQQVIAKGPKGQLSIPLHPFVVFEKTDNEIKISLDKEAKKNITASKAKLYRSIAGTARANISNLIHGVSQGFEKKLLLVGVGYRAQMKGTKLALSLGKSHPTEFEVPKGITIETPVQTEILIKGADKELVGLVASQIRDFRKPEPYKGKGIRYSDEVIELKETKKK